MKDLLANILPFVKYNGKFPEDKLELVYKILDFVFPNGKNKGKRFGGILLNNKNISYCVWWLDQNCNEKKTKLKSFVLYIQSVEKVRLQNKRFRMIEDCEERRQVYCLNNGINYRLDYDCRHNINMRDFGI